MRQQAIIALPWLPKLLGADRIAVMRHVIVINEHVAMQMRLLRQDTGR